MSTDDDPDFIDELFREPIDYYERERPATHTHYTLLSGQKLRLRLVGHNPLWGHYLWNGGQVLSAYLQHHASRLANGRTVLELGAGAGLPGIVASILGAKKVVVTDYPDAELIDNIDHNIETCDLLPQSARIISAQGYLWGSSTRALLAQLPPSVHRFDTLILADLLFNHHCHDALVSSIVSTLAHKPEARALVFFTPYRPWLLDKDLAFFDLCKVRGLHVEKVVEKLMEKVMFEEDRGDERLRRTVFGYELRWKDGVGM